MARAGTPVVLVVDDAHWADPGLISLLRHLVNLESAPILVVTTAWPEAFEGKAASRPEAFGRWMLDLQGRHPSRVRRVPLLPLGAPALAEMVEAVAPRTPPTAIAAISEISAGNPLVLSLLLDLDVIRRDISADGSIDTDPAQLRRLPGNLRSIYDGLWRQLPDEVQGALVIAAIQGTEFLAGTIPEVAHALGSYEGLTRGLDRAREGHWVRDVGDGLMAFTEPQRFQIAFDLIGEQFSETEQSVVRRAVVDHIEELKRTAAWEAVAARARRVVLEAHLEMNEALGEDAARDIPNIADSMQQLAELAIDTGEPARAADLLRRAASGLESSGAAQEQIAALHGALVDVEGSLDGLRTSVTGAPASGEDPGPEPGGGTVRDEWGRVPWRAWQPRPVGDLTDMRPSDLAPLIVDVVAVEGPVSAARVYDVLRQASGAARMGRRIRAALDNGVRLAVRRGDVVGSAPDSGGASHRRLLRLPSQPDVILRTLGSRAVEDIPAAELAALARVVVGRSPQLARDEIYSGVAAALGVARSRSIDALLQPAVDDALAATPGTVEETEGGLTTWVGWIPRSVPQVGDIPAGDLLDLLVEIVAAEGPVVLRRVYGLVRDAAGAPRLTPTLRGSVDASIRRGVRDGRLVLARGRRGDPDSRVLHLPGEPDAVLRSPGPRDLVDIPPGEIQLLGNDVASRNPTLTGEALRREVARALGVDRYTTGIDELLKRSIQR